jgi:large subunit ribosomal protein L15
MKYNELQVDANKDRKRKGRGISAGQGKTAGRGTKGQGARTGKKHSHGFMGGQRALMQAIPKGKGFKSLRAPALVVYLDQLNDIKASTIDNAALYEAGLVITPYHTVKVIAARNDVVYTNKAAVKVQGVSASVEAAINKAGGSFESVPTPIVPSTNKARADKKADKAEKKSAKATK